MFFEKQGSGVRGRELDVYSLDNFLSHVRIAGATYYLGINLIGSISYV